jgi:small subunit ribosomal protein S20
MPHTRSAKKNLRKSRKRRLRNRSVKAELKVQLKDVFSAQGGDELLKQIRAATKKLDKAAAKRVIHPNMAARKKSQLAKLMNRQSAPTEA